MVCRMLQGRQLVAATAFVGAVVVLAVQLITPSPVMVSLGQNGTETTQIGQYFTYADVTVIVGSAIACGATGTWLLVGDHTTSERSELSTATRSADGSGSKPDTTDADEQPHDQWEQTAERLRNNEETLYSLLVEADGKLPQRDLVAETDLSKATVSRTLDSLEQKDLVERKRRGMGNVIHLE